MPFPYYRDLSPELKKIYRKSDKIESVQLNSASESRRFAAELERSLGRESRTGVLRAVKALCDSICDDLKIRRVRIRVLQKRPSSESSELMGIYEMEEGQEPAISIWFKTAKKGKIVAFKTFLRTVLHELNHHIDYHYFAFQDSLHTEGFFKREIPICSWLDF